MTLGPCCFPPSVWSFRSVFESDILSKILYSNSRSGILSEIRTDSQEKTIRLIKFGDIKLYLIDLVVLMDICSSVCFIETIWYERLLVTLTLKQLYIQLRAS